MLKYKQYQHSSEFKKSILDLYDNGLSFKEIVKELKDIYLAHTGKKLTRNVVAGIRYRAGRCNTLRNFKGIEKENIKINLSKLTREKNNILKINKKENNNSDKYRLVKCMGLCGKEVLLEKPLRICKTCKNSEIYRTNYTYGSSGHQCR